MQYKEISVVIPTYNEAGNIEKLIERAHSSLVKKGIEHEVIVIDDHSEDGTWEKLVQLGNKYPLTIQFKKGKKGKAFSLLQGFELAKYKVIGMIDADLQYPPEDIGEMIAKLGKNTDIVVADRKYTNVSNLRKIIHFGFKLFFGRLLHGFRLDVQSGLKVFKKEILRYVKLKPQQWTFDLDFLLKAQHAGYEAVGHPIIFSERKYGESKIEHVGASKEIGLSALNAKLHPWKSISRTVMSTKNKYLKDHPKDGGLMSGYFYNGSKYIHHTKLHPKESALFSLTGVQKIQAFILAAIVLVGIILNWQTTLIVLIAVISLIYFSDLLHNFYLIFKGSYDKTQINFSKEDLENFNGKDWPFYTIFCPLYKEAAVLTQFVHGIKQLDYPKDKLQVMLLLEEDDEETIEKAESMNLPEYLEITVVPNSQPKTKPKACNYGLQFAKGEYAVIYDAEDIPDPKQLKKAVIAFGILGDKTQCVQAKLNFYNPEQNLLTRLFTGEYTLWFDLILTGLQAVSAPIPLGGTSNHFRTEFLKSLKGWDAFNVTEDCDLGIRLAKRGYRTAVIDSTTMEEANSDLKNWFNQRTRWVKGYMQTYFVHMRDIRGFIRKNGIIDFLNFQLVVGGKVFSMLANLIMWSMFILYFAFRGTVGGFIEAIYLAPVFYIATFSLVVGNFFYFYHYMVAVAARGKYSLVKYSFFVPLYWFVMSIAAWSAAYRLIKQPHYWSKTQHGLHLLQSDTNKIDLSIEKVRPVFQEVKSN